MNIITLTKIAKTLDIIEKWHIYILAVIGTIIIFPFYYIITEVKELYHKIKGMVFDTDSKEWITKEKQEKNILKKKIENREIPLIAENHVPTDKNDRFMFFEKRKLKIPYDQLVYVESEYNEEMRRFFAENTEWLETWQRWHGWDIAEYDAEDIKEGMLYPQDYSVFKHGFLWRSSFSSWDNESDIFGNIHYYYEIDTNSEIAIKDQMESVMRKIYASIDCF